MNRKICLCVALACFAGIAAAQTPPNPEADPNRPNAYAPLQELADRLASDDFSAREAAQRDLEKYTWRQLDLLKQFLPTVTDAEAKARVAARIQQIEEQIIIDPPPLSVDFKSVALSDVITALEKAAGEKFADPNQRNFNNGGNALFSLTAKDLSFWEIFRALNDQHPLSVQGYNNLQFYQQNPGMRPSVIVGGMAVFAQSLTRSATVNLQNPPGQQVSPPMLNMQFMVALDPRMKVSKYVQPRLTDVRDDAGNQLAPPNNFMPGQQPPWNTSPQNRAWSVGQTLTLPEKPGKKIISAKGDFRFVLELASESIDVADPDKKLNAPQTVAGQTAIISQFALQPNIINFNISRTNQGRNPQDQPPMSVAFIDSTGRQVWSGSLMGGTSGNVGLNNAVPPIKVRFSVSSKTKDVTLPFELKDLPLP